ncbi:unnamed protein product, partial [Prorocentrum cordatum]
PLWPRTPAPPPRPRSSRGEARMSAARVAFARAAGAAGRLRGGLAVEGAAAGREPPSSVASGAGRFSAFLGGGHALRAQGHEPARTELPAVPAGGARLRHVRARHPGGAAPGRQPSLRAGAPAQAAEVRRQGRALGERAVPGRCTCDCRLRAVARLAAARARAARLSAPAGRRPPRGAAARCRAQGRE